MNNELFQPEVKYQMRGVFTSFVPCNPTAVGKEDMPTPVPGVAPPGFWRYSLSLLALLSFTDNEQTLGADKKCFISKNK
jgi:hypothetical protein